MLPSATTLSSWLATLHGAGAKDELRGALVLCPSTCPRRPTASATDLEPPKVAVLVSGHLRGALASPALREALIVLRQSYAAAVFIHTWEAEEASLSWRKLPSAGAPPVTTRAICEYLGFAPEGLHVEPEDHAVQLAGDAHPRLRLNATPLACYKALWHGVGEALKLCEAHEAGSGQPFDVVLRMRADYHRLIRQPDLTPPRWAAQHVQMRGSPRHTTTPTSTAVYCA